MRVIGLIALATSWLACVAAAAAQDPRRISVMSYNVENLFDTDDNPAREGDNTYLPASRKGTPAHQELCERLNEPGPRRTECLTLDWSPEIFKKKIENLATVIGGFEGHGPDVLVLQEVENTGVIERLRDALPDGASYTTIINLDDSPGRGINVGLMSRLPLMPGTPPVSMPIDFPSDVTHDDGTPCSDTRNVTAFTLQLPDSAPLTVFAVHMPAGGSAVGCRAFVAEKIAERTMALPPAQMAIVAGDTNLNCGDEDQETIKSILRPSLIVPDEVNKGCRAPGSSFFAPQGWSFLDLIMTTRSLLGNNEAGATWFADFGSFRTAITAPELQVKTDDRNRISPRRFDPENGTGAADHWPVVIDLIRRI